MGVDMSQLEWEEICAEHEAQLDALRAEVERLRMAEAEAMAVVYSLEGTVERLRGIVQADLEEKAEAWGEVERLKAELESLRPDAERYRWICDGNGYFLEEAGVAGHGPDKARADEYIDEVRLSLPTGESL